MEYKAHEYNVRNVIGAPIGLPLNIPSSMLLAPDFAGNQKKKSDITDVPGAKLPRAINYLADYGGCALWRCLGPNFVINLYEKGVVHELTQMVLDERFYHGIKAVKLQRQATPIQLQFAQQLKKLSEKMGFKIIYFYTINCSNLLNASCHLKYFELRNDTFILTHHRGDVIFDTL